MKVRMHTLVACLLSSLLYRSIAVYLRFKTYAAAQTFHISASMSKICAAQGGRGSYLPHLWTLV
uniref:Uncharacterized protein n=1 Tax=Arundo donax TaxID=35708 RepID=A0A0A9CSA5_ARUDO